MKVIFLDIDGVLNSEESILKNYHEAEQMGIHRDNTMIFPDEYMENLKYLVEVADLKIVISSSWRIL